MSERQALFISHANPEDNAFTIWLGAKLAAAGHEVWADVLRLKGGDDWQRKLEDGLRNRACKVLLVANQRSVDKQGVRNEIQIASDVARKIGDTRFIIPLRLGPYEAPFLIAHSQYIDFSRSWASGLHELMSALQDEYKIPLAITPSTEAWSSVQAMYGRKLEQHSEQLISNWLRVRRLPENVFYYRNAELRNQGVTLSLPRVPYADGFLTCEEQAIQGASRMSLNLALGAGWPELGISNGEMRKMFAGLANQGMELFLKSKGLQTFEMANGRLAWWFGDELPATRLPFRWGELKGSRVLRGYGVIGTREGIGRFERFSAKMRGYISSVERRRICPTRFWKRIEPGPVSGDLPIFPNIGIERVCRICSGRTGWCGPKARKKGPRRNGICLG
jgi:hypothetical protein